MRISLTCFVNLELRDHELSLGVNLFQWGLSWVKSPSGWYFNFGPFRGDYSDYDKLMLSLQGLKLDYLEPISREE